MAFKSLVAAGVMALAAMSAPTVAEAKTNIIIGIGSGYAGPCGYGPYYKCGWRPHAPRYYYRPGYYFYDGYPDYYYDYGHKHGRKVSCERARSIIADRGFRKIVARDCKGTSYSFRARKNGHNYLVKFNAVNRRITSISRL